MKLSLATTLILGAAAADMAQGVSRQTLLQRLLNGRRLADGDDITITGDSKIAFNSCKSVSTYNEDLFSDEYSYYAQHGELTSQKAYIVFDVIPSNGGYSSYYTSTSQQYMTDVQGYIESLLEYNPQQAEAEEGEEEQEGENNNVDDEALEWIQSFAECQEIEDATIFDGQPVYSAFSCNSDGTGVTLGTFLDDECTLETNLVSAAYFMQDEDSEYLSTASSYLATIFTEQLDCANYEEEQDNNGDNEANEFCQNLFDGDMVISLSDCGAYYDQDQADQEGDQDQADQEEDEYDNSWYTFDISEEDADNVYAICTVVQNMTSVGVSGNQYTDENEVFDFESYKTSTVSSKTSSSNANSGAIVGGVIGGLVAVVAIAGAAVYYSTTKAADSKKTPLILEANDKKQAVV